MKISIDKDLVEFAPESQAESRELEVVWRRLIDCVGFSRKLQPVGEFIPGKNNVARFTVEKG